MAEIEARDDKARELLERGLAIAPDGIDANYFYGDLLLDQGKPEEAIAAFEHALAAPVPPGRASADARGRGPAREALARVRDELR